MTLLRSLSTVRARLLAIMALIVIPLALMAVALSYSSYRTALAVQSAAEERTVSDYANRTFVWYRGTVRTAAAMALSVYGDSADGCTPVLERQLRQFDGYVAAHVQMGSWSCFVSVSPGLTAPVLKSVLDDMISPQGTTQLTGAHIAAAKFGATFVPINDQALPRTILAINARDTSPEGTPWIATVFVEPRVVEGNFQNGALPSGTAIAIVKPGPQVLLAKNIDALDRAWLPATERVGQGFQEWLGEDQSGGTQYFGSMPVQGTGFYVIGRFDRSASMAAGWRLTALSLIPLAILLLIALTVMRAIQTNVSHWITGIETAARARSSVTKGRTQVFAPVHNDMPSDIRTVAEAYNSMIVADEARTIQLENSLARNRALLRELHHRVKNSLQVIQSYLALSRRNKQDRTAQLHLAEAETKVYVLSCAYRLALAQAEMHAVPVEAFAEEVISFLGATLLVPGKSIVKHVGVDGALVVDRAIPLGLAITECVAIAFAARQCRTVSVSLAAGDHVGEAVLTATTDQPVELDRSTRRILSGLAAQLQVMDETRAGDADLLRWRFSIEDRTAE